MTSLWKGHQTKRRSEPGLKGGIVWWVSALPSLNRSSEQRELALFPWPSEDEPGARTAHESWQIGGNKQELSQQKADTGTKVTLTFYLCGHTAPAQGAQQLAPKVHC